MVSTRKKTFLLALSFVFVFSVFAFINTDYSYAATKKPAKVTNFKISKESPTSTKIKLSWGKAKNAKKYQIYKSDNKSSGYSLIKTTSKRSYSFKQSEGIQYYKVRAINGKLKGKFSSVKSINTSYIYPVNGKNYTVSLSDAIYLEFNVSKDILPYWRNFSHQYDKDVLQQLERGLKGDVYFIKFKPSAIADTTLTLSYNDVTSPTISIHIVNEKE